jgi:GNAT superfamily N-acetyltransferase
MPLVLLRIIDGAPAGLANCFEAFSTFSCKPLINIHDLMVLPAFRGNGISQKLLQKVEDIAQSKGCCKVTLEVLSGNEPAKASYEKFGFSGLSLTQLLELHSFGKRSFKASNECIRDERSPPLLHPKGLLT